jgi:acyl carrier protein
LPAGSDFKPDVPLVTQGFDSLDVATLMLELERAYNKSIPVENVARLRTVDQIAAFLNG